MILSVAIVLSILEEKGRDYSWERPICFKCKKNVWGHGFVQRFFNDFKSFLWIRRWRCPHCQLVITCRPDNYWKRYQEQISRIFEALKFRVQELKWPPWTSRQRGGHWLRKINSKNEINKICNNSLINTIEFFETKNLTIN